MCLRVGVLWSCCGFVLPCLGVYVVCVFVLVCGRAYMIVCMCVCLIVRVVYVFAFVRF